MNALRARFRTGLHKPVTFTVGQWLLLGGLAAFFGNMAAVIATKWWGR